MTIATSPVHAYAARHSLRATPVQSRLAAENATMGCVAHMQVSEAQGAMLTLLTAVVSPLVAVEIGTFTGYSASAILRGMPDQGRLICFDINADWSRTAARAFTDAGLAARVDLRLGPASWTLRSLGEDPPLDMAFLDADKVNYLEYYELLLPSMRPGALLIVDNVLQGGRVMSDDPDESAVALREFNAIVAHDPRVEVALLPAFDGVSLVRKRG